MRSSTLAYVSTFVLFFVSLSSTAQEASEIDALTKKVDSLSAAVRELRALVQGQQARIESLEDENKRLREAQTPPAPALPPPTAAPARRPVRLQSLNPEIAVLVDMVASSTESVEDEEGNDRFSVREIELIFGMEVDTYGRLDLTLALSDFEEIEIEEAYFTYWDLPGHLRARVGRLRPKIGKATAIHRDRLDTVDEPFVVQRYLGVEGLFKTGIEVSRFLPRPVERWTPELTLGVMEGGAGEDGTLFGESRRRLSFYGHLKNFVDISPSTSAELGITYLLGSEDGRGNNDVSALGVDLTAIHHFSPTRRVKFQSELYKLYRDKSPDRSEGLFGEAPEDDPFGFYTLVDMRLTRRWGFGGRFDYVELVNNPVSNPRFMDRAYTGYLTFFQSEFARLRLQYQHARLADGDNDDRFFLQWTYVMGVDKHPIQ